MEKRIKIIIIISIFFLIAFILVAFNLFPGIIKNKIKGRVIEGIFNQPLEGIQVCWQRYSEFFGNEKIIDFGCIKTDEGGNYQIPKTRNMFVSHYDLYYNYDITEKIKDNEKYIEGTRMNNKEYSTDRILKLEISEIPFSGNLNKNLFKLGEYPELCNNVESKDQNRIDCFRNLGLYYALKNKNSTYCEFIQQEESNPNLPVEYKFRHQYNCIRAIEAYYDESQLNESGRTKNPCEQIDWRLGFDNICNKFLNVTGI